MREPIDLGTFTARAADINRRALASKAKRDRGFMLAVAAPTTAALLLAYVWTTSMVIPAWERVTNEHQEQIHASR